MMYSEVTCRIERDGKRLYTSTRRGIAPLVEVLERALPVRDAVVYDRIVGKAAALLYVCMGIKEVHASVLSMKAVDVFREYRIPFTYETLTEHIVDRKGDGVCPMEKTVAHIDDPQEAFAALRTKLTELQSEGGADESV